MIDISLRTRVFLLAFLPMLLITIILSIYFLNSQLNDIDNSINDRGTSMAIHIANASEFGLFSGNTDNLNNLLQNSILEEGIRSISITDKSGDLFVRATNEKTNDIDDLHEKSSTRVFRHPIILHTTDITGVDDFKSFSESDIKDDVLGWIELHISTEQIDKRRNQIVWDSTFIILFGLMASILLSLWMGRSITSPIVRLTQAVYRVENGNMDETIDITSSGEIGTLEKGFTSMLNKIRLSQKDLQEKIDETTLGLKNSLKIVEKQNEDLTEARIKALDASNTKSRFLANISHEIRTPMNGILGFVRLLKNSNLTKEQLDYLDTIEKSSNNLLNLIEDILDISRIEEGKITLNNKSFDLRSCIEDVIMLMAPAVLQKNLDITYFYYRDVPEIISAPYERIRQVLINFVGNAIKFSDQGTIIVRIMLDPDTNKSIRIIVSDQGIGIPENEKEKIFTPFTQIDDTSTRKYGGSGLGLAISKSITKAMGGKVGLEDNSGGGTSFWFTFPFQANDTIITHHSDTYIRNPVPVLLYDSNPDTLRSIHVDTEDAGYSVTDYSNYRNLENAIVTNKNKLLCILSLSHNEVGNTATKEIIEKIASLPNKYLMVLISSIESSDVEKTRECGADACLTKPYRHQEFTKLLSKLSNTVLSDDDSISTPQIDHNQDFEFSDLKILLAEDNAINTKLIQTVLGRTGANIIHANNGEEAIEAYDNHDVDIILMDIQMPIMNGIDAVRKIRKSGTKGKITPIIGMTANALPGDIASYMNTGFNDVLIKPISVDDLMLHIQNWIKQPHGLNNSDRVIHYSDSVYQPDKTSNSNNTLGISKKLSDDLYNMLIEELPLVSKQLKDSFTREDWSSLRKQVHKLLGGISYCNVPELKTRIINFQSSLRENTESVTSDFEALMAEIEKLT